MFIEEFRPSPKIDRLTYFLQWDYEQLGSINFDGIYASSSVEVSCPFIRILTWDINF